MCEHRCTGLSTCIGYRPSGFWGLVQIIVVPSKTSTFISLPASLQIVEDSSIPKATSSARSFWAVPRAPNFLASLSIINRWLPISSRSSARALDSRWRRDELTEKGLGRPRNHEIELRAETQLDLLGAN